MRCYRLESLRPVFSSSLLKIAREVRLEDIFCLLGGLNPSTLSLLKILGGL